MQRNNYREVSVGRREDLQLLLKPTDANGKPLIMGVDFNTPSVQLRASRADITPLYTIQEKSTVGTVQIYRDVDTPEIVVCPISFKAFKWALGDHCWIELHADVGGWITLLDKVQVKFDK